MAPTKPEVGELFGPGGEPVVMQTAIPPGVDTFYTGAADTIAAGTRGDGPEFFLQRTSAGDTPLEFQFIDGICLTGGFIGCKGGENGDYVDLELYAPATPVTSTPGTGNCNLVPTGIPSLNVIVPAPLNDGSHTVDLAAALNANLAAKPTGFPTLVTKAVPVPTFDAISLEPNGFYHWDDKTGAITPVANPAAPDGAYNLYDAQLTLVRHINRFPLWSPDMKVHTFNVPTRPKHVLPHWIFKVNLHQGSASAQIDLSWALYAARSATL